MKRINIIWIMLIAVLLDIQAQQTAKLPSGATLEIYLPSKSKANGRCVLIIPGGAYRNLAVDGEGRKWAPWFNDRGYVMAMLSYRMPHGNYEWPLQDGREAMALLREKGETWRIKNGCVGIMGFSAGGHVASTIATKTHGDERPAFQILYYPVITMDPRYTHADSRTNLLGSNPSAELEEMYSNEKQVASDNPPCFICYAADDDVVPIANSKEYYNALVRNGVSVTIKEYPKGGHGFGFNTSFAYHEDMLNELENWLRGLSEYLHDDADTDNCAWTDVTAAYVPNSGFEESGAYEGNVALIAPPSGNSTDYASTGWKLEQMSDWCCSAIMEYGSKNTFSKTTCIPPSTDNNGNAGKALAISIGRTYQIRYVSSNEITLPAGHYRLRAWCINQNIDSDTFTEYHSMFGFVPNEGEAYLSTLTGLVSGKWNTDVVEFTLMRPVTGRLQVGGKGVNNNKPSAEHAKVFIDNITLECLPELDALIDHAIDIELPEANIGDGAFQYPAEPIINFKESLQTAQQIYEQYRKGENVDLDVATTFLRDAIDTYEAVKDYVNPPAEGKRYKLTSTFDWMTFDAQLVQLTGAVLTLSLHATQAVPGTYVLGIGPSSQTKFTDQQYLAQAFFFIPVDGVPGGFKMGITDEEGYNRFVCSGAQYAGGNSLQLRTTTDFSKALIIRVIPTNEEGVVQLRNTDCNINMSFKDYVAYCWSEMTNRSDGFHIDEVCQTADISINLTKGSYSTCIFPYAVNIGGETLNEIFQANADKVEVYSCFGTDADNITLTLTPMTDLMANTPYIIRAAEDFKLDLSGYGTAIASSYTYGWLVGNYEECVSPIGCYTFSTLQDGRQGFCLTTEDSCRSVASYQAYLQLPESYSGMTSVVLLPELKDGDDDPHTDIMLMNDGDLNGNKDIVYDISGRRVGAIHNGFHIVRMPDGKIRKMLLR